MATTVGGFVAIDDTEIDAESPITETLMTRMRDNSYWIDAGTRRTTETSSTKVLTPNGSGGVQWVEVATIADPGVDGTKGGGPSSISSGSPTQIAIVTGKILVVCLVTGGNDGKIIIDASNDTFAQSGNSTGGTGTVTGSYVGVVAIGSTNTMNLKKNGTNYEFYTTLASGYSYVWL